MLHRSIIYFTLILLATACSPKLQHYTERIHDSLDYSESELRKVQFYLSGDIILRRSAGSASASLSKGTIRVIDGREVEEVIIKAGTPGVLVDQPSKDRLAISFEESSRARLLFGVSKRSAGRFDLLARDWKNGQGTVEYGGKSYTVDRRSAEASLMVDFRRQGTERRSTSSARGRRID